MLLNLKDMKDMKTLYSVMKKFDKIGKLSVVVSLGHNCKFLLNQSSKKNTRLSEIYMEL